MKLKNGIIRPGIVIEVLENNVIRAGVPGLFNRDDGKNLPIIFPAPFGNHTNQYSQIHELDEVWVFNFTDNPLQLYWFRKDDVTNNKEILTEENVEILCNKETGTGWATIYFSDGTGWIIKNVDSIIQLHPDGHITIDTGIPNRAIDINSNGISLGSIGSSAHPAAYGDVLTDIITDIQVALNLIKQAANMSPYTKPISTALGNLPSNIEKNISKINSPNVTLD